jgi:hypothetical protein
MFITRVELSLTRRIGSGMWFMVSYTSTHPESRADLAIDDSNWNPATFTIQDAKVAEDQNPFDISTWNPDISAFRNAGGKLRKKVPYSYLNEGSDGV